MSFVRSQSPPPPMPSPQLVPTPLPSPPPLHPKIHPSRLIIPANHSPPIPPRLIGSPLLQKTLTASRSYDRLDRRAKQGLFGEDDEFGASRRALGRRSDSSISSLPILSPSPTRTPRRSLTRSSRCRSPPPSPMITSPPPPVPPIPSYILTPPDNKSTLQSLPKRATAPTHHAVFDLYIDRTLDDASLSNRRCMSTPHAPCAMTCMQFFAIHNTRKNCQV